MKLCNYHSDLITGKRDIQALQVKCRNVDRECEWEGTVGTLEEHVALCDFTLLPCTNECKNEDNEIVHFTRKVLLMHLIADCPNRDHTCEHCGEKGTYVHITQVHDNMCERKVVTCPNRNCTERLERQSISHHLSVCDYFEIQCKYKIIGCDVKIMRKDIPAHEEDDKLHLRMALDEVATMKKQREEDATKILRNGAPAASLTFALTGFTKKKDDNDQFNSPTFYSSPKGYHMVINVYANGHGTGIGTHLSAFVNIMEGKYDDKINWPFIGKVTCELLNQLEDRNHEIIIIKMNKEDDTVVGSCWGNDIAHSKLSHDPVKNTQYLKDDTLYFRVSVDMPDHKPWLECTA